MCYTVEPLLKDTPDVLRKLCKVPKVSTIEGFHCSID